MLYHNLARSFDDLAPVTALIAELENPKKPAESIVAEEFLITVFEQIKIAVSQQMKIFCNDASIYINYLIIESNGIIIQLHEVIKEIENRMYLANREVCMSVNLKLVANMLRELVVYFEELGMRHH